MVGAQGRLDLSQEELLGRICPTCSATDPDCDACSGLGFITSRAEIQNWMRRDESELARVESALNKTLGLIAEYEAHPNAERKFATSMASLSYRSLGEFMAKMYSDRRVLRSSADAIRHSIDVHKRCLDKLAAKRAQRKERERAPEPVAEVAPKPVEQARCDEDGCNKTAYVTDEDGAWCKRHAHARGSLVRDAVPESDPEPAPPLPAAGNASVQAGGRGYRFVGGPADGDVIEVPRGHTEWQANGGTYIKRGHAFVWKELG